jgi:hypothetical protein
MNNKFKIYTESLLKENTDNYVATVRAAIYLNIPQEQRDKYDYDMSKSLVVGFGLDIEARSWGIKSISPSLRSIEPFDVELMTADGRQVVDTIHVQVDPTKLQMDMEPPTSYIGFSDMDIFIDANGNVDYTRSSIKLFGI